MALGIGIFLSVLGAILAYAVTAQVSGINIQKVGAIFLLTGIGLMLWSVYRMLSGAERRRRELLGLLPELREEVVRQPDVALWDEQREFASALAAEARVFLEAEGFTGERIDELAAEFVASDIGRTRDEFTAWALSQHHLGPSPKEDSGPLAPRARSARDPGALT